MYEYSLHTQIFRGCLIQEVTKIKKKRKKFLKEKKIEKKNKPRKLNKSKTSALIINSVKLEILK